MATVNNPLGHDLGGSDFNAAGHRYDYSLVEGLVRLRLMDGASLRNAGVIPLVADLAGSGSDTARLRAYDDVGYGLSMASMAAENTGITASTVTAETDDIAIGRYGLEFNATYTNQILRQSGELDAQTLAQLIPWSYEAAWMDSIAASIATASSDSGTSGVDMSVDDLLDAIYFFDLAEGDVGQLTAMLHGQQVIDLKESIRAEPAFQYPEETTALLRQQGGPGFIGAFLGVNLFKSTRVTAAGGNRHGAVFGPNAIGWVRGGTQNVQPRNESQTIRLDDQGLIIELTGTPNSALSTVNGNAFFGTAIIDQDRIRGMVTDQ